MVLQHQAAQALFQHVRVDLGGGDVRVTEQLLYGTQVGAAVQQMAGESMTEHVRAVAAGIDTGFQCQLLELLGESLSREMPLRAPRREEPPRLQHRRQPIVVLVLAHFKIAVEGRAGCSVQRYHPLAATFALNGEHARVPLEDGTWQRHKLRNAHASRIKQFDQTVETERSEPLAARGFRNPISGSRDEPIDLCNRKRLW